MREAAEGKPVKIGQLQRYAVDALMATGKHPYARAAADGQARGGGRRRAGGARLRACAQRRRPSTSVIFEARPKVAGLNEYGIAAYKTPDDFAAREAAFILSIGGIEVKTRRRARPRRLARDRWRKDYDAVFLGARPARRQQARPCPARTR